MRREAALLGGFGLLAGAWLGHAFALQSIDLGGLIARLVTRRSLAGGVPPLPFSQCAIDPGRRSEVDPRMAQRDPLETLAEQPSRMRRRGVIVARQRPAHLALQADVEKVAA